MRRTADKKSLGRIVLGDHGLGEGMAAALGASGEIDRYTHGFHTWPAGLHADAARDLVALFPGAALLDPFCGGGTVLVEALAAGRRAYGNDLAPIAVRVARARTCVADEAMLTRMRSAGRALTEAARSAKKPPPEPILGAVSEWYAPYVLCELEAIRSGVAAAAADIRPLLEVCFSSILVKTSWRESDTSPKRVKHDRPAGTAAILFHKKVRELGRRVAALRAVVPPGIEARVNLGDARRVRVPEPVDLVLTSPPYPSTYDYLPLQHLRRVWLGESPERDDAEIGARRHWREGGKQASRKWQEDTVAWTQAAADALAPGGHLVVVIGDGLAPSGAIDTSEPTEAAARKAGLVSVARASLERPDFGRETTRWEHVFAFRK